MAEARRAGCGISRRLAAATVCNSSCRSTPIPCRLLSRGRQCSSEAPTSPSRMRRTRLRLAGLAAARATRSSRRAARLSASCRRRASSARYSLARAARVAGPSCRSPHRRQRKYRPARVWMTPAQPHVGHVTPMRRRPVGDRRGSESGSGSGVMISRDMGVARRQPARRVSVPAMVEPIPAPCGGVRLVDVGCAWPAMPAPARRPSCSGPRRL